MTQNHINKFFICTIIFIIQTYENSTLQHFQVCVREETRRWGKPEDDSLQVLSDKLFIKPHQGVFCVLVCPWNDHDGDTYLLQQLIVLHVLLGSGAGALCLLLESFVGGHERGLLWQQRRKTTQQPASDTSLSVLIKQQSNGIMEASLKNTEASKSVHV